MLRSMSNEELDPGANARGLTEFNQTFLLNESKSPLFFKDENQQRQVIPRMGKGNNNNNNNS